MAVPVFMNQPTRVESGKLRFLIIDAPSNDNLEAYIRAMRDYGVTDLVRTCESTYDDGMILSSGIRVHELLFDDGEAPGNEIIDKWMELVRGCIKRNGAIAVHCVAGLGRAPVLVAIAFVEEGMDPIDAITFVRDRRKGAINRRQLQFLKSYKCRTRKKSCISGCSVM